jgi:hypothetical protein
MASLPIAVSRPHLGKTLRQDRWWLNPLAAASGLTLLALYATWAVFQGRDYYVQPYLSPFYSPCVTASCPEDVRFLGIGWWPFSPAILMMGVIIGFRTTCYYYRKAYYRAFFLDPPACAVGEARGHRYKGERAFPLILQNVHRYFLYLSVPILLFLWYDTFHAFRFSDGPGVGVGSLVLLVNVVLLTGYLTGCHSLRHLVGGSVDCWSCARGGGARRGAWKGVTIFNRHHMLWAWTSLFVVCAADLYVRLVARGVITDIRLL